MKTLRRLFPPRSERGRRELAQAIVDSGLTEEEIAELACITPERLRRLRMGVEPVADEDAVALGKVLGRWPWTFLGVSRRAFEGVYCATYSVHYRMPGVGPDRRVAP